ncbi:hypothetical protein [Cochleicola gelatinilyticus]|uniref:Uncharacterized protein n=1 Tax=Cochleicola gelatinilyticus TaxID=1763537 RepID=A0A167HKR5_9FLAO|nr:hypothetical protein [Cochleicola gelatinilyticus]OAB78715.1 hypothetical protein ULVI_09035 [Cochleicola gelatinilyticus]
MENFTDLLGDITFYLSICLPFIFFIKFRNNGLAYRSFTLYLLVVAIIQVGMKLYVAHIDPTSNLLFFVYYFVLQFILLSIFYKKLLTFKWVLWVMIGVLIFIGYQYYKDPQMYFRYNPTGVVVTQSILVLYSLLYFYRQLITKGKFLIINIGLFFYLLSSMLIFSSGNLVFNVDISKEVLSLLTNTNLVLYFIFQILILLEWYINYSGFNRKNKNGFLNFE